MAANQTIQIKRRNASDDNAPPSLAVGEMAYNEYQQVLYIGKDNGGAGQHQVAGGGVYAKWPAGTGFIVQNTLRSGATPPTSVNRSIAGTANAVTVSNGDGVAGNPTIDIADNPILGGTDGMQLPEGTTAQRPGSPGSSNYFRYNTTDNVIEWWNGSTWVQAGAAGGEPNQNAFGIVTGDTGTATADVDADTLDIAGGTNITTAATDGPETVTINLDVTADIAMATNKITGMGDPTADQDAATKAYVDSLAQGLDVKASCVVNSDSTSTEGTGYSYTATGGASGRGQITWTTGPTTIDGVTLANNDRILNTETGAAGGIYVRTAQNTWDRATDFDEDDEVTSGSFTFVEEGTNYADSGWVLTTNDPITIGGASGTSLSWAQFSGAGQITAGAGLTKTGNTLDVGGTASRITVNADSIDISASYVGQASITTLGTITTGVWQGTAVTETNGGTNQTTYAQGDILYASAANTLSKLAKAATGQILTTTGTIVEWTDTIDGGTF